MMPNPVPAAAIGLPAEPRHEIRDHLMLALDATEQSFGYTQPEREARSHMRAALSYTRKLMGAWA